MAGTDRGGRRVLPRGRHSLSRAEIAASQRTRLLRAMIDEVAEHGYVATTAASVYTRAGVSSRSFYEQFANKQDCFLAAYDEITTGFVEELRSGLRAEVSGPARFEELVRHYLDGLRRDPAFARAALIEIYAAGEPAMLRRQDVQEAFVELMGEMLDLRRPTAAQRFAVEALVGAITFMVTSKVALGHYAQLPTLSEPLCAFAGRVFPESRGVDAPGRC